MGERLTKEREAEIRRVVDKMGFHPTPALVRALLAELDATRDELREAHERISRQEASIAELRDERDGARAAVAQRWALRREVEAILGVPEGAASDEQLRLGVEAARRLVSRAEAAEAHVRELHRDAVPSNCTLCHGRGSEPPHGPDDGPCPRCGGWTAHKRLVAAEPDALRKRIADLEAQLAAVGATPAPLYTSQERVVLIQRAEAAEARVRELEAERDVARRMGQAAARSAAEALGRSERAEADLAETRAQLARLREAAEALCGELTTDRLPDGGTRWQEALALRDALSTPGPTLAEMRAEALRLAADRHTTPDDIRMWLRRRADDLEAGSE